ncbi:hypothetical protein N9S30_00215 [bacterium]|nr:hypothetical protein [bacterium]
MSSYAGFVDSFVTNVHSALEVDVDGNDPKRQRLDALGPEKKAVEARFALGADNNAYMQCGLTVLNVGTKGQDLELAPASLYSSDAVKGLKAGLIAAEMKENAKDNDNKERELSFVADHVKRTFLSIPEVVTFLVAVEPALNGLDGLEEDVLSKEPMFPTMLRLLFFLVVDDDPKNAANYLPAEVYAHLNKLREIGPMASVPNEETPARATIHTPGQMPAWLSSAEDAVAMAQTSEAEAKQRAQAAATELQQARMTEQAASQDLVRVRKRVDVLQREADEHRQKATVSQRNLDSVRQTLANLRTELDTAQAGQATVEANNTTLRERIALLEKQAQRLLADTQREEQLVIQARGAQLRAEEDQRRAEEAQRRAEQAQLRAEETMASAKESAEAEIAAAKAEVERANETARESATRAQQATARADSAEASAAANAADANEARKLRQEATELRKAADAAAEKLEENKKRIEFLKEYVEAVDEENERLGGSSTAPPHLNPVQNLLFRTCTAEDCSATARLMRPRRRILRPRTPCSGTTRRRTRH